MTAETLIRGAPADQGLAETGPVLSGTVMSSVAHQLSILVPTYRDDATPLIRALSACAGAENTQLIVFDDGSGDRALAARHEAALADYPGASELIVSADNLGRSEARNRLVSAAESDWILLIDADMLPDDHLFLSRYLEAADRAGGPSLVAGGFSLKRTTPTAGQGLHAAQSRTSECIDATARSTAPGRYVFSSNILVHRSVFDAVPFDPEFTGWGWEDVDWGLRIAEQFNICHIDNTATHLGLDSDAVLIRKYASSAQNFARMAERHPKAMAEMPLFKASFRMRKLGPVRPAARWLTRTAASLTLLPTRARLLSLKLFRALVYSEAVR